MLTHGGMTPRACLRVLGDEVDDVLDRLEVLELLVGDLDAKLVLGRDGDLDHGQRVDVEVVDEVGRRGHLVGGGPGDLFDDLREPGENLLVSHSFSSGWLRFTARAPRGPWGTSGNGAARVP